MRFSTIAAAALAATPAVVSAAGTLGYAIGNKKADGSCKSTSDYAADFDALKSTSTIVRTYSASECNTAQNILPAATSKGFKVILGVWWAYPCHGLLAASEATIRWSTTDPIFPPGLIRMLPSMPTSVHFKALSRVRAPTQFMPSQSARNPFTERTSMVTNSLPRFKWSRTSFPTSRLVLRIAGTSTPMVQPIRWSRVASNYCRCCTRSPPAWVECWYQGSASSTRFPTGKDRTSKMPPQHTSMTCSKLSATSRASEATTSSWPTGKPDGLPMVRDGIWDSLRQQWPADIV